MSDKHTWEAFDRAASRRPLNLGFKVALVALLTLLASGACNRCDVPAPEAEAETFIKSMEIAYRGKPTCTHGDTDNDGYVTCLVRLKEPNRDGSDLLTLSCGAQTTSATCSGGCKFK